MVVIESVLVEVTVRFFVPLSTAPFGRPAVVVSFTTFTPTDAPTPLALPSVDCFAVARAWLSRFDVAVNVRSAPFSSTGLVPSMSEVVVETTTLTAIEPATPTLLPPAPEVALALYDDADGAVVSTVTLLACRLALLATKAFVFTTATSTATPMPIPELVSVVGSAPAGVLLPSSV